jgi:hypothetical protein
MFSRSMEHLSSLSFRAVWGGGGGGMDFFSAEMGDRAALGMIFLSLFVTTQVGRLKAEYLSNYS